MKIFYGSKTLELQSALTATQALEVVKGMGFPEFTSAEALPNGDVILSVKQATKG